MAFECIKIVNNPLQNELYQSKGIEILFNLDIKNSLDLNKPIVINEKYLHALKKTIQSLDIEYFCLQNQKFVNQFNIEIQKIFN